MAAGGSLLSIMRVVVVAQRKIDFYFCVKCCITLFIRESKVDVTCLLPKLPFVII